MSTLTLFGRATTTAALAVAAIVAPLSGLSTAVTPSAVIAAQYVNAAVNSNTTTYLKDTANGDTFTLAPSQWVTGGAKISASGLAVELDPPVGQQFTSGTDYDANSLVNTGRPVVAVSGQPGTDLNCAHITLHIDQVDYDANGTLLDIAARYRSTCSTTIYGWGVVQYGATASYAFPVSTPPQPGGFGQVSVNTTLTKTMTFTNRGNAPVQLGAESIRGLSTAYFQVSNDTCANTTVAAGATCTADLSFTPTAGSSYRASAVWVTDTYPAETVVQLSGSGVRPPNPPTVYATAGDDGIAVSVAYASTTSGSGIASPTGYQLFRDDDPSTPIHTGTGNTPWVDPVAPGVTHTYTAVTTSTAGPSPSSQPATATALGPNATPGTIDAYTTDVVSPSSASSSVDNPITLGPVSVGQVTFIGSQPNTSLTMNTTTSAGRLVPGTYTAPNAPYVSSSWNWSTCPVSVVHVYDADIRANGTPDVLTADYTLDCADGHKLSGEIRWHSSTAFHAASAAPVPADAGSSLPGQPKSVPAVVITNTGTAPLVLGAASITGTNASDFTIGDDACSNATLQPTETCTVQTTFTPSGDHARSATLVVPDNTPAGSRRVPLLGSGAVSATAPQYPYAVAGAGRATVHWGNPADDGGSAVTSYEIFRGPDAASLSTTPIGTVGGTTYKWIDHTAATGAGYVYGVRAITMAGPGSTATTAAITIPTHEVVYTRDIHGFGNYALVVGPEDGSTYDVLLDGNTSQPAVSPDGNTVAFVNHVNGDQIWTMPIDGSAPATQLTTGPGDGDPAWSPNGTQIAYDQNVSGADRILVTGLNGGGSTVVANGSSAYRPSYTPSGRELVVGTELGSGGVDVIGLDGTGRRHVAGTDNGADPQVSPDGTSIAFVIIDGQATDSCSFTYPVTHLATIPYIGGTPTTILKPASTWLLEPNWWPTGNTVAVQNVVKYGGCLDHGVIDHMDVHGAGLQAVTTGDSWEASVRYADMPQRPVTPTAAPSNVTATLGHGTVTLHWTNPTASNLWKIVVRRSAAGGAAPTTLGSGTNVTVSGTSAKATGLTDGKAYAFSVFAIDKAGTVSARATRTAKPLPVPVVAFSTAPTGLPFTVKWAVAGATSYDVRYAKAGGKLGPWLTGTKATSAVFGASGKPVRPAKGTSWIFSVRAHDSYGNLTGWSTTKTLKVT